MKRLKKILLTCFTVFALSMCFQQTVKAETYSFVQKSGETEAHWYTKDYSTGTETEIAMEDIPTDVPHYFSIYTMPTAEVVEYLNGLNYGIVSFNSGVSGDIVLGTPEADFGAEIIIDSKELKATIYADGPYSRVTLKHGTVDVYGNLGSLTLGSESSNVNECLTQSVTVSGNVDTLKWYRDLDLNCSSAFQGTLNVAGIITEGNIYDCIKVEEVASFYSHTYDFLNASGAIIENGSLAEEIICTETEYTNADYFYQFSCYCYEGATRDDWVLWVFVNDDTTVNGMTCLDEIDLIDFDPADLPEDASVHIMGNYEEPMIIPKSLKSLNVFGGADVIVQGNVDELEVTWYSGADDGLYKHYIDITVTGTVGNSTITASDDAPLTISINGDEGESSEPVDTSEHWYYYMKLSSESEAKWYEEHPTSASFSEIFMEDMVVNSYTTYIITATPTTEVIDYLNALEYGNSIQITTSEDCSGTITLGTSENAFKVKNISLNNSNTDLIIYTDELTECTLLCGNLTVYGDVQTMLLDYSEIGANEECQAVTINGDIAQLDWWRSNNPEHYSFNGDMIVSSVIASGTIYEHRELRYGEFIDREIYTFADATGTIISDGTIGTEIDCAETEYTNADYTYQYWCSCYAGGAENNWYLWIMEEAEKITRLPSVFLVDFDPADLPEDASVLVEGNYGEEPLVIPHSVKKLSVDSGGEVILEGDVEQLILGWYSKNTRLNKQNVDVIIKGNVKNAIVGLTEGAPVSLTVNGIVEEGIGPKYTSHFSDSGLIMKEGILQVPAYFSVEDAQGKNVVGYIRPLPSIVRAAAGITEEDNVLDDQNNVVATKAAMLEVTEDTTMAQEEKDTIEADYNVDILGVLAVEAYSYYVATNGLEYTDDTCKKEIITELPNKVPVVFTIPVDAQDSTSVFSIIRKHDGAYDILEDTDSDPTTVTVLTDKFSSYMLVKSETLPGIDSEEPSEPAVSPVEAFVTRMYQQCLSRNPDQAGLDGWVGQLENGYMNGAKIAEQFVFSNEMLQKNLSNGDFVDVLYRAMMGREADADGKSGWVSQLDRGLMSRSQVTKSFVESVEFTKICGNYGIERGTYDASIAPIEKFVTRFYTLCLGRPNPDQAGLYGWVGQLKGQHMNGAQIADSFFFSTEYVNKNTSNDDYVACLYSTLMGRTADAEGKAGWVSQLEGNHMTRKELMKAFIESTEFTNICQNYGITRGSL